MSHVAITDHALIRYIERVHGICLDAIRDELADKVDAAAASGAASFFDGVWTYRFDGNRLVTIVEGRKRSSPKHNRVLEGVE